MCTMEVKIHGCSYYICEIFLSQLKWLIKTLHNDNALTTDTAEEVWQFLEAKFSESPSEPAELKSILLHHYWLLAKAEFTDNKCGLVQSFSHLIKTLGYTHQSYEESQSKPSVSDLRAARFDMRKSFDNTNEEYARYMEETSQIARNLQKQLDDLQVLKSLVNDICATGQRDQRLFEVISNQNRLQQIQSLGLNPKDLQTKYIEGRKRVFESFRDIFNNVQTNCTTLFQCIFNWKQSHIYAYIKAGHEFDIEQLKTCCSSACKLIIQMLHLLSTDHFTQLAIIMDLMPNQFLQPDQFAQQNQFAQPDVSRCITTDRADIFPIKDWQEQLTECFKALFIRSFVVVEEPTSVQKVTGPKANKTAAEKDGKGKKGGKGKKDEKQTETEKDVVKKNGPDFNVKVQLLCGGGLDSLTTVIKPITAKLCFEGMPNAVGELHIQAVVMDNDGVALFQKQKIKNYVRPSRNKKDFVTSERYRIEFETEINLSNPNVSESLKTMSLPIAFITGSNQANKTHGALLWYCYNNNPYDLKADIKNDIPRQKFEEMIQDCFRYLGGRSLRPDEIDHLFKRMLRKNNNADVISKDDFIGDNRKQTNSPTFWKWLQSILNLLEYFLKKPWQDGLIHGFISKDETIKLLHDQKPGVFLLRFSENQVTGDGQNKNLTGAIVAAFACRSGGGTETNVVFGRPLTVDSYFSKFSFGRVLDSHRDINENTKKKKKLLKKLYGTALEIDEIKQKYTCTSEEQVADKAAIHASYPNWDEQTILILTEKFGQCDVESSDDDDDDDGDDGDSDRRRKVPRRSNYSESSGTSTGVASPESSLQGQFPANAANEMLQYGLQDPQQMEAAFLPTFGGPPVTSSNDVYSSFNTGQQNIPVNIPGMVQEMAVQDNNQQDEDALNEIFSSIHTYNTDLMNL